MNSRIKKLGTILHFSDLGNAIVKNPIKLPKISANVVDEKMIHIGNVNDIFGPVENPYVSIRIKKEYKENITSETQLYVIEKRKKVRTKKYKNKRKYSPKD